MHFYLRFLAALGGLMCELASAKTVEIEQIATLPIPHPAFVKFLSDGPEGHPEILVSSFSMFGGTRVSSVHLAALSDRSVSSDDIRVVNDSLIWPNEISEVPESVSGPNHVAVATGFLVPGRSTGAVALLDLTTGETIEVTTPKKGWFYHRTVFHDMNGDGRLDIVTARAQKSILGGRNGELLWLEQPVNHLEQPWEEHFIGNGPDVYFRLIDIDQDGSQEIIAAEFFEKKLTVFWRDGAAWSRRTIDDTIGAAFDLDFSDLNGDGHTDMVVTNHEGGDRGAIYAFQIPAKFKTATWHRKTLLSGIKTELMGINQASPGTPIIWQQSHGKPHILVAGDGSTKAHWLVPRSEFIDDWSYEAKVLIDTNSTIGSMALGDVNSDGIKELFVPAYDKNQLLIFKLVNR